MQDALQRLHAANARGWGAFIAIGLRRKGLTRYRRGATADVVALPALFVDVDNPHPDTLIRLQEMNPTPSCISFTGGGYHAYWFLNEALTDMVLARKLLRALAKATGGDSLSPVQSLRLVNSRNSKPSRKEALCRVIHLQDSYYPIAAFDYLLPVMKTQALARQAKQATGYRLNPDLLQAITQHFIRLGYKQSGDWLSGPCIYPHNHHHDDAHPSFGFNTRSGYGNCFKCGSILLKDIYTHMEAHI